MVHNQHSDFAKSIQSTTRVIYMIDGSIFVSVDHMVWGPYVIGDLRLEYAPGLWDGNFFYLW